MFSADECHLYLINCAKQAGSSVRMTQFTICLVYLVASTLFSLVLLQHPARQTSSRPQADLSEGEARAACSLGRRS